jgi:hypothetical protein
MHTYYIYAVFLLASFSLLGQSEQNPIDSVSVYANGKFKMLENAYFRFAESNTGYDGYRIQIFNGNRREADQRRGAFLREHPNMKSYLTYDAPEYRVQVGDFRDRINAHAVAQELKKTFSSAFVVDSKIESPSWEEEVAKKK